MLLTPEIRWHSGVNKATKSLDKYCHMHPLYVMNSEQNSYTVRHRHDPFPNYIDERIQQIYQIKMLRSRKLFEFNKYNVAAKLTDGPIHEQW